MVVSKARERRIREYPRGSHVTSCQGPTIQDNVESWTNQNLKNDSNAEHDH